VAGGTAAPPSASIDHLANVDGEAAVPPNDNGTLRNRIRAVVAFAGAHCMRPPVSWNIGRTRCAPTTGLWNRLPV